jgi:transcriptional antiterminator NusG
MVKGDVCIMNNETEKQWYVVNTYSGHESKVKEKLESKIESMGLQDNIYRIIIPETTEIEVKDGVKKEKTKKMFPGYVLVEMVMTDEAWYIVRNTPGVTGFIGSSGKGAKPTPLLPQEIDKILANMGMSRVNLENDLSTGDKVSIIDGPFSGMVGKIDNIDIENNRLNIIIDLFGQETSVDVEVYQVSKI